MSVVSEKAKVGQPLEELLREVHPLADGGAAPLRGYRLRVSWKMSDVFLYAVGWSVLILVTIGIAGVFLPLATFRRILNGVEITDESGNHLRQLRVELPLKEQWLPHLLWFLAYVAIFFATGNGASISMLALLPTLILQGCWAGRTALAHTRFVSVWE